MYTGDPNLKSYTGYPTFKGTPVKPTKPFYKNLTNVKGRVSPRRVKVAKLLTKRGTLGTNYSK